MSAPEVFHRKHLATAPRSQRSQSMTGANHGTTSWPKSKRSFVPHSPCHLRHSQPFATKALEVLPVPPVRLHEPATSLATTTAARSTERPTMPCSGGREGARGASALNAEAGQGRLKPERPP